MNRIVLQLLAVAVCFAVGQSLRCYNCKIGIWSVCITTETTCDAGEHCYSGTGTAVGFVDVSKKGCLKVNECNKTSQTTITDNSTIYSMTKTCCSTDLCNAAPGLPGASGVSLAFATLTALLVANVLV